MNPKKFKRLLLQLGEKFHSTFRFGDQIWVVIKTPRRFEPGDGQTGTKELFGIMAIPLDELSDPKERMFA